MSHCLRHALADEPLYTPHSLPGDRPVYAPDRSADIRHIALEFDEFDLQAKSFRGVCMTTLAPIMDGAREVVFDAVELQIESVTNADGAPLAHSYDGARLRITLPGELAAGAEVTTVVRYHATPRRGLYFTGPDEAYPEKPFQIWTQGQDEDARHYFPCHDSPNVKATSELTVTVPGDWTVVANGRRLSVSERPGGLRQERWLQEVPHASYLVTLAAGDFGEVAHEVDGLPVRYYAQRGREAEAQRSLERTPAMLRFFNERIGVAYPYPKYDQVFVQDFIFGGMENTSATTLTDTALLDERAALDTDFDGLVAHELAHQWFGDLLTCREWAHGWLNEGFATYWEALFTEHHKGVDEFRYELWSNANLYMTEDREGYRRPIVSNVYHGPIDIFDRHLYEKGSLVLHMLRYVLGDAGFWKAMNHYVLRFQGQNVVTSDLVRAIEEATGRNLDWFFDQWVFKGGFPKYEVFWTWDAEQRQASVTVKQTQPTDDLSPLFRMPVEIAFHGAWGEQRARIEVDGRESRLHLPLPERPTMVRFDPGNAILKDLDFKKEALELTEQLQADEDCIGRIRAAQALGALATLPAVAALANAAREDRFWGVQAEAAKALGVARTPAARAALLELINHEHPKTRRAVVEALGAFRAPEAAAALRDLLAHGDPSYQVEGEAAKSLGKTRQPEAFDEIVAALERPSWNSVIQQRALEGLGELQGERGLAIALDWTTYGRPQPARALAVGAIEKLGKDHDTAIDRLIDLLEDPWLRVRIRSAQALATLKVERAAAALERMAGRDLDGRAVRAARIALRDIRKPSAGGAETKRLHERLDAIEQENRELKERLERLEAARG